MLVVKKTKILKTISIELPQHKVIKSLQESESYKYIFSVPISSLRFANYEPFLRFHEPLFEEFQKNRESKERHFLTFVARFLMPL